MNPWAHSFTVSSLAGKPTNIVLAAEFDIQMMNTPPTLSNFNAKLALHIGPKADELKPSVKIIYTVSRMDGKSSCIHRHRVVLNFS